MSASVEITLDTQAPTVVADAVSQVEPPEVWLVGLDADEDISTASLSFRDSLGIWHPVGYHQQAREVSISIPTADLASGPGMLIGYVSDDVGNAGVVNVPVSINRTPTFEAALSLDGAYSVSATIDHAIETTITLDHSTAVTVTLERS